MVELRHPTERWVGIEMLPLRRSSQKLADIHNKLAFGTVAIWKALLRRSNQKLAGLRNNSKFGPAAILKPRPRCWPYEHGHPVSHWVASYPEGIRTL